MLLSSHHGRCAFQFWIRKSLYHFGLEWIDKYQERHSWRHTDDPDWKRGRWFCDGDSAAVPASPLGVGSAQISERTWESLAMVVF